MTINATINSMEVAGALVNNTTASSAFGGFTFGVVDYIVFITMLLTSTSIGIYFGFFSKSKNTTDEYLMGGKRMKVIPIAISLVASQLSAISIMSVPAETYSFGFNYFYVVVVMVLVVPILCYVIVPVFYENNFDNCYEYLEKRFDKRTRQLVTGSFLLNSFLKLPVFMFVPALAFSQVTGINVHLINTIASAICVFYTMLGGIKAVVWTDVVQAGIMLSSVSLVGFMGTMKIGGLSKVLEYAAEGGRLETNLSLDPRVRLTLWNGFFGGLFMWLGHIGLDQSCVQRIVSLPSIKHARKSLVLAGIGFILIMGLNSYIGIAIFARYHDCDPVLAGHVEKPDKMVPFFVQDVIGHLKGMPGLFISCVFSASLSTLSAILNSMGGVVYFDYIKPFIRHTDARANYIMKIFVIIAGCYCVAAGFIVEQFSSILQMIVTITAINTGAVVGVFLLGMFVPRANAKAAIIGVFGSLFAVIWIIINNRIRFSQGVLKYTPLPSSTEGCEAMNMSVIFRNLTTTTLTTSPAASSEPLHITTAFDSNRDFSIYEISFYWFKVLGLFVVWIIGIPLGYYFKQEDDEKLNPKLFSPLIRKYLKQSPAIEMDEKIPLKESPIKLETVCDEPTEDAKEKV